MPALVAGPREKVSLRFKSLEIGKDGFEVKLKKRPGRVARLLVEPYRNSNNQSRVAHLLSPHPSRCRGCGGSRIDGETAAPQCPLWEFWQALGEYSMCPSDGSMGSRNQT